MTLLEDFSYEDPNGRIWKAKAGSVIDGASIPQFAWSIIKGPYEDKYRDASVIHDVACQEKTNRWELVHETFYYAMRASGVGETKAKVMYAAVYFFGPRWDVKVLLSGVPLNNLSSRIAMINAKADKDNLLSVEGVVIRHKQGPYEWSDHYDMRGQAIAKHGTPPPKIGHALISSGEESEKLNSIADVLYKASPRPSIATEESFKALEREIEKNNLSLEAIRDFYPLISR